MPDTIKHIITQLQKNKIECYHFSVVTNGTILNTNIADIFNEIANYNKSFHRRRKIFYLYGAEISISHTPYHHNDYFKAVEFYKKHCSDFVNVLIHNNHLSINNGAMFKVGRAQKLENSIGIPSLEYKINITGNHINSEIQLNATGTIGNSAIVEFNTEDKLAIGNIAGEKLIKDMIIEWNKTHFLSCKEAFMKLSIINELKNTNLSEQEIKECKKILNTFKFIEDNSPQVLI